MNKTLRAAAVFIGTFIFAIAGMLFVNGAVGSWYAGLEKPPFTPPNFVFPIVWTLLYLFMAAACTIAWLKEKQDMHSEAWVRFYFAHLLFNVSWTIFFFGFHALTIALLVCLVLFFFVLGLTASAWELDRRVSYLMMPYLFWMLFACYLSAGVWLLN